MQASHSNPLDHLVVWFRLAPGISNAKRKIFIGMMLVGAAFLACDLVFADVLGYDSIINALIIGMMVFLCLTAFIFWRQRQQQELTLFVVFFGTCLYLVTTMTYSAWRIPPAPEPVRLVHTLAPWILWIIIVEVGCYFTFRAATALRVSLLLTVVTAISIAFVLVMGQHLNLTDLHDIGALLLAVMLANWLVYQLANSLEHSSQTDYLTRLPNRAHGYAVLEHEIDRAARYQTLFAIILLDIDYFKKINDQYGHVAGDLVLREFADFTREHIRGADFLARWGGEEFLLILPESDLASGRLKADYLRTQIKNRAFRQDIHITSSFGVTAYYPRDRATSMLERADAALYHAKASGRNCVVVE